ncbi:MAG: hypothetical protein ABFD25_20900 [Clostridiaceae bacterium]
MINMLVQTFPKAKVKKHRPLYNHRPTANDICRKCGTAYAQTHEVFEGTGRRQLSIKYGMQVKLCWKCHAEVPNDPLFDLSLKREYQHKFERKYGHVAFMLTFGRDYLSINTEPLQA